MELDLNQRKLRFLEIFREDCGGPTLEIERLILRAWRQSDLEPIAAYYADPTTAGFVGDTCNAASFSSLAFFSATTFASCSAFSLASSAAVFARSASATFGMPRRTD